MICKRFYFLSIISLFLCLNAFAVDSDLLVKGWNIRMGLGYVHTGTEMDKIWTDGFAWEMLTLGYNPIKNLGVETGFIMGLTGMNADVKKKVSVVYEYGGSGTQESTGGGWGGVPFGVRLRSKILNTQAIVGIGFGGLYGFEEESGISAEGYYPRWTHGLGYYGLVSLHFVNSSMRESHGWGVQARYVGGKSEVTDFVHELNPGVPPETLGKQFLSEGRLIVTLDIFMDFHTK